MVFSSYLSYYVDLCKFLNKAYTLIFLPIILIIGILSQELLFEVNPSYQF